MKLIPAIDLYKGSVIRLVKGDYAQRTIYSDDPFAVAKDFYEAGCRYIHIVDLEGAEVGYPKHLDILSKIANRLDMKVQYGGGMRTKDALKDAWRAGASHLMIGSILFKTPDMPQQLFEEFGADVLTPSVDTKDGKVMVAGWKKETQAAPQQLIKDLAEIGYKNFLVTAVDRDGTMKGPDVELYRSIGAEGLAIIAAGGVSSIDDLRVLKGAGVWGAAVGKAIYEGKIDLRAALAEMC